MPKEERGNKSHGSVVSASSAHVNDVKEKVQKGKEHELRKSGRQMRKTLQSVSEEMFQEANRPRRLLPHVCSVMTYSPSQNPENLGFSVLNASFGHTVSLLELQKSQEVHL
jgi:hypothetical protein